MTDYPDRPGYVVGCDTSEAAADSLSDVTLTKLRMKVYSFIVDQPNGATCDETEAALNLRHQTVSARIRELALANRIYDTGRRRRTRSNRTARIYTVGAQP
jgi:predicted transcriptional regulator